MDQDWEACYRRGETPWEKGKPHPALVEFLRRVPLRGRGLVPGCGHGHDVRALASGADEVIGIDIAPAAIEAASSYPEVGGERYILGDLFDLPRPMRGSFDWVFEHTCFCAIPPARRADYARSVAGALKPGGDLLAIFYLDPGLDPGETGPPFGVSVEELDEIFGPYFTLRGEWVPSETYTGRDGRELCRLLRRVEE